MIKLAKDLIIRSSTEEFITFKLQEKDKGIQVRYENETLWMTQKAMAELFDVEQPAIAKHLINIYNEKELDKNSTYSKMELVQKEGTRNVKRNVEFYNLDAIISVGYRVNSLRATQFRRWATNVLKTFTIQGYVLDKERMKKKIYDKEDIDNDDDGLGVPHGTRTGMGHRPPQHDTPVNQPALRRSPRAQRGRGVCLRQTVVSPRPRHVRLVEQRLATSLLAPVGRKP